MSPSPTTAERLVLVADDDPIFRSLVAARLNRMSYRVIEAEDGGSVWRTARDMEFDLAIVDFEMPGLNGISLIQCLRGHLKTQHLPIVMCTSRTDGGAMREAIDAGITSFLTKPVNWSLFEHHIGHLFNLGEAAKGATLKFAELEEQIRHSASEVGQFIAIVRRHLDSGAADAAKLAAIRKALENFTASDSGKPDIPTQRVANA